MSFLHNTSKRASRRGWGIHAYVGANGGGKSAAMVWDAVPDLEAGRPILSTVRILDYTDPRECDDERCLENPERLAHFKRVPTEEGRASEVRNAKELFFVGESADLEPVETTVVGVHEAAHPLWIPWTRWDQLLRFNFGRVLADEMTGIASSRESQTLPSEVLNHLQQLRRADIPFAYTCPDWARADKSLREPTQAVTVCTGYLKTEAPLFGDQERVWKARRLFNWRTYDARALDQLTEGKKQDVGAEVKDWHWGPSSLAFRLYDTFAPVLQVGTATESGRCFRCGGTRPPQKCSCSDQQTSKAPTKPLAKRGEVEAPATARRLTLTPA
jgi:hypothetical protein